VKPYVVRIVSHGSGVGKTTVGTHIVENLVRRGYVVGVVKHCREIDLEEKDSSRYIASGALRVVASCRGLAVLYVSRWSDDLEDCLAMLSTPIVVVEGFRDAKIGEKIVVYRDTEALNLVDDSTIAIVAPKRFEHRVRVYTFDELDELSQLVADRALDYVYQQLPKLDCGHCGYATCLDLAKAYLRGEARGCPRISSVTLRINGIEIPMNPFVKNLLRNIVRGFIASLKGVPQPIKRIEIEIRD